jgi:hypothetical protein
MHVLREVDENTFEDKTVVIIGNNVSANDLVQILLLNPNQKHKPKKVYMTGRQTQNLHKSTDYDHLYKSGDLAIPFGVVGNV